VFHLSYLFYGSCLQARFVLILVLKACSVANDFKCKTEFVKLYIPEVHFSLCCVVQVRW